MLNSFGGQPICSSSTHKVKGLGQIDESNVEGHLLFTAFLLQVAQGEQHVDG